MTTVDHICSAFLRQILLRMKELGLSQTDLAGADGYFLIERDCEGLPKGAQVQVFF